MEITIRFDDLFYAIKYQFQIRNNQFSHTKYRSLNHHSSWILIP